MRGEMYFDEKQRERRRRILKLKIYGVLTIFLLLIAGAGYAALFSTLFEIKEISIVRVFKNNPLIYSDEELISNLKSFSVQNRRFSFLKENNIFIWGKNIELFLKNHPQIAGLIVKKNYLGRKIIIEAEEREKFGAWCSLNSGSITDNSSIGNLITNNCRWFDKSGVIFAEAPLLKGNLIDNIYDFSGRDLQIGQKILEERFIPNLLKIFEVLEESDTGIKSLKLEKFDLQEIVAEFSGNYSLKIYFSLRNDPRFAVAALNSLKKQGWEKFEYIDLRVENRVYYKLK